MASQQKEIRAFTGLRGIAALYVVLYHFGLHKLVSAELWQPALSRGYLAVDLFFVLSGFVMALTYASFFQGGFRQKDYISFLCRRIARIYPLYICVTLLFLLMFILFPHKEFARVPVTAMNTVTNILMIQSWGIADSYVGTTWSISTEWAAYIVFPFLLSVTLFCRKSIAILSAVACFAIITALATLPDNMVERYHGLLDISDGNYFGPLIRCLSEFAAGILTYRFYKSDLLADIRQNNFVSLGILAVLTIILFIPNSDAFFVWLLPLLLLTVCDDKTSVAKWLGSKPVHWLGLVSYSLYLMHVTLFWTKKPVMGFLQNSGIPGAELVTCLVMTSFAFILAGLTYEIVEKPGRNILRHLLEPKKKIREEGNPNLSAP